MKKTVKVLIASAIALAVFPCSATAQDNARFHLTLQECIDIALSENPTIKIADKEVAVKKITDQEAWMSLLPTLDATGSLSHSIKVAEIRTSMGSFKMGMDGTTTAQGGVTLALPIFAPAIYQSMRLTKDDIKLAQEKARSSRLDLINQVTKAYFSALMAQDSHEVVQKSYQVAEDNFKVVEQKFNVGKVSEYDKISSEVQVRSMNSSVVNSETAVRLALLNLKVLMGIDANTELTLNDSLRAYENQMLLPQEVSESDLENNSTIRQDEISLQALQHTRKKLYTNFMPTLGASLTGQYQSMSNDNWNLFKYSYSPSISLGIQLSIPLFKASNFTSLKKNRLQIQQTMEKNGYTRKQISLKAQTYRQNMISNVAKLQSDKRAVDQADKAVNISRKRYDVGRGTILELNQSQINLVSAELTYNQGIYDYLTNRADLECTLGHEK